jgi:hypothetical protein
VAERAKELSQTQNRDGDRDHPTAGERVSDSGGGFCNFLGRMSCAEGADITRSSEIGIRWAVRDIFGHGSYMACNLQLRMKRHHALRGNRRSTRRTAA